MLTDEERHKIDSYLMDREKGFAAQQELAIRDAVKTRMDQIEQERRAFYKWVAGIVGVTFLAIAAFTYNQVQSLAETAAKDAAKPEIEKAITSVNASQSKLEEAEEKLRSASQEFDALKESIRNTNILVLSTERQIQDIKLDALQVLAQVNTIKGGVMVMDNMSNVLTELNELRLSVERSAFQRRLSDAGPGTTPGNGPDTDASGTIEGLFPANDQNNSPEAVQ